VNESKTIAVDLAKDVFELVAADAQWRIVERQRLTRTQLSRYFQNRMPVDVVMESCGTAHYWARTFEALGHTVRLLPSQYVRAYRRRNKTDRSDATAILEAARSPEIKPVAVKNVEQQTIQGLHRVRSQWMTTRTARINVIRGLLRELGYPLPVGSHIVRRKAPEVLEQLPAPLRAAIEELLEEIRSLEQRIHAIEDELERFARQNEAVETLREVPGIGLLTATALWAAAGSAAVFKSGRHLAAWLGVTPREYSSGNQRHLGRISKRGDVYVRMLITHGARSVLARAKQLHRSNKSLTRVQRWAVQLEQRIGHNKATCALANKLARIAWALWRHHGSYDGAHVSQRAVTI